MQIHYLHCSYHRMKALANSSLLTLLRTPSHSFLNSSWVMVKPASSFYSLGKRK